MAREQNVAAQQSFGEEVISKGNLDAIDEMLTPDFVDHDPAPDQRPGAQGLKDFWRTFRAGFSDLSVEVDHLVADDESVAIAYRASGTHDGEFAGMAATGRRVDFRGLQIGRFVDGRLAERWGSSDQLTMMQQIQG